MTDNAHLHRARSRKSDEFLTRMEDIERELANYPGQFTGKSVLCNCDDPYRSSFFRYFAARFNELGLRRLVATCIGEDGQQDLWETGKKPGRPALRAEVVRVPEGWSAGRPMDPEPIRELLGMPGNYVSVLESGDFRGPECRRELEISDAVATNPPFSLFREYVEMLDRSGKKFLVIGSQCALTYNVVGRMLEGNRIWLGCGFKRNCAHFISPYEDEAEDGEKVAGMIRVPGVQWFTNMDHRKRHEPMRLVSRYDPAKYPKYANSGAINIDRTADIPADFDGPMGVPITFLNRWCPEQFEIVGFGRGDDGGLLRLPGGRQPFFRIIIRKAGKNA